MRRLSSHLSSLNDTTAAEKLSPESSKPRDAALPLADRPVSGGNSRPNFDSRAKAHAVVHQRMLQALNSEAETTVARWM